MKDDPALSSGGFYRRKAWPLMVGSDKVTKRTLEEMMELGAFVFSEQ